MNRCAVYARFSSDNQKDSSIEDQLRNCRNYAAKHDLTIDPDLVFKDEAISGSISNARPGYQALMKAAEESRVNAILVDSLDRISRDQEELHRIHKRLKFKDVTLIGVTDGYNGADKLAKVNLTVKGLMSEMFIDDLRDKTRRGLEGVFLNKRSPGGAPYGYRSVPIFDPVKTDSYGRPIMIGARKEIDPEKAEVVRKIFHMFMEGYSTKKIAHHLNELGIPSPRNNKGGWSFSTICGDRKKAVGIFNNPIYIGRPCWNRTEWLKNPVTERRVYKKRSQEEWIHVEIPELRIISDELWLAAKERREKAAKQKPFCKPLYPKYLLSGLLTCSVCGCSYIMQRKEFYYCSGHLNRGNAICTVDEHVRRSSVESTVIEAIATKLLDKTTLLKFIRKVEELVEERYSGATSRRKLLENSLRNAIKEKENILNAIKLGVVTPGTKEALLQAEAQVKNVEDELARSISRPQITIFDIAKRVKEKMQKLDNLWKSKPIEAREELRTMVDRIVIERGNGGTWLHIHGKWDPLIPLGPGLVDMFGCGGRI